jgi:hypothetical protein
MIVYTPTLHGGHNEWTLRAEPTGNGAVRYWIQCNETPVDMRGYGHAHAYIIGSVAAETALNDLRTREERARR